MKARLAIVLLLIVLAPVGLLGWLGVTIARNEQDRARERYARVLSGRLADIRGEMAALIETHEGELLAAIEIDTLAPERIREVVRRQRLVKQLFLLDTKGELAYPREKDELTQAERGFLQRTKQLWESGETFYRPADTESGAARRHGWHSWFWGDGLNLVFWKRLPNGRIAGAEVERSALMADIIGHLPPSGIDGRRVFDGRIALLNAKGQVLYQWGACSPAAHTKPDATEQAPPPLQAWALQYFTEETDGTMLFGRSAIFNIVSGLSVVGIALMALAFYFYRESARDMREAANRVSFVNQVSHELKTPLTNIRMYAELLEQRVGDQDDKARNYVDVLVSESTRLSRLITNVLTFGKSSRRSLKLRMGVGVVDDVVRSVAKTFEPALTAAGIKLRLEGNAARKVMFDADALEQILGNLFSNVEKYAASASQLTVSRQQTENRTTIRVCDDGPGIPVNMREAVFRPFVRLSNKLTDGVTGTGIGLSIARDLACLHGGNLTLKPGMTGAAFELTLSTPAPSKPTGGRDEDPGS